MYSVVILRTDGEHLIVVESENYDECFEKWNQLQESWQESVKDQKPFVLKEPLVTAFHPILIKEITLRPVTKEAINTKYENPYKKQMLQRGFSETFNKYTGSTADLLDDGYK